MANVQHEEYEICPVPSNSEFDLNIGNFTFEIKRLIEGIILGSILAGIVFLLVFLLPISTLRKVTFMIMGAAIGLFLAIKGVNGNSISEFIVYVIMYNKNKRITFYSPNVKYESKFFLDDSEDQYIVPRERIDALVKKYINNDDAGKIGEIYDEAYDPETMIFEDELGAKGKPEELMTEKELKKYKKAKQKEAKRRAREKALKKRELEHERQKQRKVAGIKE